MAQRKRRRFKPALFSRLTRAWLAACLVLCAIAAAALFPALSGRGVKRLALPVDALETVAPSLSPEQGGLRLAAPGEAGVIDPPGDANARPAGADETPTIAMASPERIAPPEPAALDEPETLTYPEVGALREETQGGQVVITIPGSGASPVRTVSSAPDRPIAIAALTPSLTRAGAFGAVPTIGPGGERPLDRYAAHAPSPDGPRIAIVIGGLGLNAAVTERAIDDLPAQVSLAFAPYAKNLEFWTKKARANGHEVLIELPMEGFGRDQAGLGAAALLTAQSPKQIRQRLDWLLSRVDGYVGATNYLGQKFVSDGEAMATVLAALADAGLGFVDDTGSLKSARMAGAPVAGVTRMIPPATSEEDRQSVRRALRALEAAAHQDGFAIGKTYAYAATIEEIAAWRDALAEQDIALAPVSAALRAERRRS